jgi:hypothetical protein
MKRGKCPCCGEPYAGKFQGWATQYRCGTTRGAKGSDHLLSRTMTCLFNESKSRQEALVAENIKLQETVQRLEITITEITKRIK